MTDHQEGLWFIDPANVLPAPTPPPKMAPWLTIRAIQEQVCREYGLSLDDMLGPSRCRKYSRPRQLAMYRAYKTGRWSLPEIARYFGNRDHTTVLHAVRVVEQDPAWLEKMHRKKMRWACKTRTNVVQLSVG